MIGQTCAYIVSGWLTVCWGQPTVMIDNTIPYYTEPYYYDTPLYNACVPGGDICPLQNYTPTIR